MVLWALEQRRKWQAEREQREQQLREEREQREQKLREEGRVRGREELAALLLREAREGESVRQALERIDNRHTERKE